MFHKLVAIEPVSLIPSAEQELHQYAEEVTLYRDIPADDDEIARRIGDADAVLLSYTSRMGKNVIERCPNIRYIGMCCSLYDENSASVDIRCAREHSITVLGVRDYGDIGVGEYVISQLTDLLHGFHGKRWGDRPLELTGIPVGIIGMGATGQVVARSLRFFGADVTYYSRSHKPEIEAEGIAYLPLDKLLQKNIFVCTCLNKFVTLLHQEEFEKFGNHKILFNTGLTPASDLDALRTWLSHGDNYYFCDSLMALGDESLKEVENVSCYGGYSGGSYQAIERLTEKSLANLDQFLAK